MQDEVTRANKIAWESGAYKAWVHAYGTPKELAERLKMDPQHPLRYWLKYIGNPTQKRVLNLFGSHGKKAISLAILGADVTVVDISEENCRYASDVADAAGVKLDYICADVLQIPNENRLGDFDIVLMEFGILHYFTDLNPVFSLVYRRLRAQGRLLLTDYHPFARGWMGAERLTEPTGDYFDDTVHEVEVAFAQLLPEADRSGVRTVRGRNWTVGGIVTAIAERGLFIRTFEEIPNQDPRYPEFYTVVADKIDTSLPPLKP